MNEQSQAKLGEIVLVPCIFCERQMKPAIINIRESYPASLITNIMGPQGQFVPRTIPAYLCKTHYDEQVGVNYEMEQSQKE